MPVFTITFSVMNVQAGVLCQKVNEESDNVNSHLRNKCPISFKQLWTFRAASKQLPDFISQGFRNSLVYERSDLSWALADVLMPAFEDVMPAVEKIFISNVFAHNTRSAQQRFIIV